MKLLVFIPHLTETDTKRVDIVSMGESNPAANSQSSLRRALKTPPAAEEQPWLLTRTSVLKHELMDVQRDEQPLKSRNSNKKVTNQ